MDLPGISFRETDGQVFLRCEPAPDRPPVDSATLHALLAAAGYGDCLPHEEAIASAARDCSTELSPFERLVAQRSDAAIQVQIAPDEMAADVSLSPARGGKAATMEDLMRALVEAGVLFGVDEAALLRACAPGSGEPVRVASGISPEDGHDTVFEEMIPQAVDRAPQLDEDGLIDYREHGSIAMVQSGAPLMRRIPPTAGVVGHSIRGRVLAPHPGRDESFAAGLTGAQVASDDPNLLQAAVTGQPVRVKCGIMVEPILRVAEVNMTTGNIHYDGTVQVDGDILQGMKVQASGDIVVSGMVDGGLLEAGGNIQVKGGVIAHARLRAGGSVSARFAQGTHIYAGTVIAIDDMALECELQSLNQIIIGAASPKRGQLIGGSTTAMMLVKVPILGSDKAGVTQLVLGHNPELDAKYQALQERIAKE
ncbi:MAG: FapA family protein, partial [Rhodoferax sp.]|nr:FapA family protein [Rhodoferax sp.]